MIPDDRLNQLEPLLSEALTVLDRHTAQLKQHTGLLNQVLTIAGQHSDTLGFVLQEQAEMKAQMQSNQEEVNGKLSLILEKLGKLDR
ncbi:hypothetical protein [Hymenobacter sp.]|jgi:hypothetical protein|uniref:hypothetical protein n=1 Tax=Hymenobacter sp. TaxID=1898978 RepID=UPI002ED7D627